MDSLFPSHLQEPEYEYHRQQLLPIVMEGVKGKNLALCLGRLGDLDRVALQNGLHAISWPFQATKGSKAMLYMVVERFKTAGAVEIYRRAKSQGRMLPEGLEYVSSWVDLDFTICYQLMQTNDPALFEQWISQWSDLVDFEIIPVQTSAEASQAIAPKL
jgi:hypothetical protein